MTGEIAVMEYIQDRSIDMVACGAVSVCSCFSCRYAVPGDSCLLDNEERLLDNVPDSNAHMAVKQLHAGCQVVGH